MSIVPAAFAAIFYFVVFGAHGQSATNAGSTRWPSKPIRWVVPFPPGGGADVLARTLSPKLAEALGQPVVVENRSGASGNIGAESVAKASADGYTILFALSGTHAINPAIYRTMPFKEADFAPVIWLTSVLPVIAVIPSLPVKTVGELVAYDKANPGKLSYGTSGNGTIMHLSGEMLKLMTDSHMVHIPYRGGGPAMIALLAGEVQFSFAESVTLIPHLKSGKLRALAITTAKRSAAMPDVPTVAESGVPGYEVESWNGVLVPAATPREIIARLNAEFNKILSAPEMRERLAASGYEPIGGEAERFGLLIGAETVQWSRVAKAVGLQID